MYDILIVDDEAIVLEGLKKVINWDDFGLEIKDTALSAAAALELLRKNHYDILITDVYMKDMTGHELIRRISEENIPVKSIIISGYDKFDYVKEAIALGIENYLLKPLNETELSSTLINIIDKLNQEGVTKEIFSLGSNVLFDSVIYRWLNSSIEPDEFLSRAALLGINTDKRYYTAVIIKLYKPRVVNGSSHTSLHMKEINSTLNSAAFKIDDSIDIYSALCPNNNILIVAGSDSEPDISDIKAKTHKMMKSLCRRAETATDFFACIGVSADGWENAGKSYKSALKMLSHALIMPLNTIIAYNDIQDKQNSLYSKHMAGLKSLDIKLAFIHNDHVEEQYISVIESIFDDIKSGAAFSPEELYSFIAEMIFTVFGTLQIKEFNDVPGNDVINMILNMRTIDEIMVWFITTIRKYIASKHNSSQGTHGIVRKLVKHVEMYYYEDMSLKSLSYKFNHNPSYLGQIFKDETGMLFTDYLCNIRVEHAKELLKDTNMKTRDISTKVGFRNANYFSNVFKKKTGCYPTMYRELNTGENL